MSTVVCLCKGISEEVIVEAIKNGATTVDAVKATTGAADGGCRGFRCAQKIEELIANNQ